MTFICLLILTYVFFQINPIYAVIKLYYTKYGVIKSVINDSFSKHND